MQARFLQFLILAGAIFAAFAVPMRGVATADYQQERRAQSGVRFLRIVLQADLELDKKTAADGALTVVFFYRSDAAAARKLAEAFAGAGAIRGLPVKVETTADSAFGVRRERPPAAVFFTEPPSEEHLSRLVEYGIQKHVITFSPFEGEVENGVAAGLSVEAQVRPLINTQTLERSKIVLKPFFLKATKTYP